MIAGHNPLIRITAAIQQSNQRFRSMPPLKMDFWERCIRKSLSFISLERPLGKEARTNKSHIIITVSPIDGHLSSSSGPRLDSFPDADDDALSDDVDDGGRHSTCCYGLSDAILTSGTMSAKSDSSQEGNALVPENISGDGAERYCVMFEDDIQVPPAIGTQLVHAVASFPEDLQKKVCDSLMVVLFRMFPVPPERSVHALELLEAQVPRVKLLEMRNGHNVTYRQTQ
ncbi:MAG: hypothetical protein Q9157_007939 [Trypethelium eluteriae]